MYSSKNCFACSRLTLPVRKSLVPTVPSPPYRAMCPRVLPGQPWAEEASLRAEAHEPAQDSSATSLASSRHSANLLARLQLQPSGRPQVRCA
jgi:hypothetical protein